MLGLCGGIDELPATYWLIGNEMMDIVTALPPSNGQTTAKVGDEHADERVDGECLSDG